MAVVVLFEHLVVSNLFTVSLLTFCFRTRIQSLRDPVFVSNRAVPRLIDRRFNPCSYVGRSMKSFAAFVSASKFREGSAHGGEIIDCLKHL